MSCLETGTLEKLLFRLQRCDGWTTYSLRDSYPRSPGFCALVEHALSGLREREKIYSCSLRKSITPRGKRGQNQINRQKT
ncbi:hypothetical protein TNCV_1071891 [Trichonephila clavipes]|nr:hypothetical protein TNCV_1071891 [Trichonephila clavipes]